MGALPLYLVDAFTDRPFAGNPAGVCLLDRARDEAWMQRVAAEMNQAETAFLEPQGMDFKLRWFSPAVEIDLCGHATLASAHVIWEQSISSESVLRFHTRSGVLTSKRVGDRIELDFPALEKLDLLPPAGLLPALGITETRWIGGTKLDYMIEVGSAAELRELQPNSMQLRASTTHVRGVIVTSLSDEPDHDILSRFFAPGVGIEEDPVTGSAHCALAPYWAERLGKQVLRAYQASPRGGTVETELIGDRVLLRGHARTILAGTLFV